MKKKVLLTMSAILGASTAHAVIRTDSLYSSSVGASRAGSQPSIAPTENVFTESRLTIGSYIYVGAYPGALGVSQGAGLSSAAGAFGGYVYVLPGSYLDGDSPVNQHSTVTTEAQVIKVATQAQLNIISDRIREAMGGTSMAAGGNTVSLLNIGGNAGSNHQEAGLWARASYDRITDASSFGNWDANLWSAALGVDYKFVDCFLAGISVNYNFLKGDTFFNSGTIKDHSWGVSPYISFQAMEWLDFDAVVGYNRVHKKRTRRGPSTATVAVSVGSGPEITGNPESKRYFGALFANLTHTVEGCDWLLRLGVTHAEDRQEAFKEDGENALVGPNNYTDMKSKIDQAHVRLQLGFNDNRLVTPYVFGSYAYDLKKQRSDVPDAPIAQALAPIAGVTPVIYAGPNTDRRRNTWGGGIGLSFNKHHCWTGGIEVNYRENKKLRDFGVVGRIRYVF